VNIENLLGWLNGRGGQFLLILRTEEKKDSTQEWWLSERD